MLKKIMALALAVIMMMAMSATVFAEGGETGNSGETQSSGETQNSGETAVSGTTLTNGEVGGSGTFATDNPKTQSKTIKIAKELKVYNVDETKIQAPTMSYSYAITAGEAGIRITDATTDHANSTAVTVNTQAGVTPTLVKLMGTSANTIAWTPAEQVDADTNGAENLKYLAVDFSEIIFGAAGVYRYVLTETPDAYAAAGVTENTANVNKHVRYLDVYVRPATEGFTDGKKATDWDIYGYVCMLENEVITDDGDTAITGAVKTNGFVSGTNDGEDYIADQYYTYNVTVSKTVTNDAYAKATHAFPFTVIFTNGTITKPVDISSKTTGTVGEFTDPAVAALSEGTTKGVVTIKDSSSVKYIGIPTGTQVEVYETNDMSGVTYQVTTKANITGTEVEKVDVAVTDSTKPGEAVAQAAEKAAHQSTKTSFTPKANEDDDVAHTIAVDNHLQVISPTGVVLRVAPYALMLGAGFFLLMIGRRRRNLMEEI